MTSRWYLILKCTVKSNLNTVSEDEVEDVIKPVASLANHYKENVLFAYLRIDVSLHLWITVTEEVAVMGGT